MRRLVRLGILVGLAAWAWRAFVGGRKPAERAVVAYADGSSIVLEPESDAFERLAATARTALSR